MSVFSSSNSVSFFSQSLRLNSIHYCIFTFILVLSNLMTFHNQGSAEIVSYYLSDLPASDSPQQHSTSSNPAIKKKKPSSLKPQFSQKKFKSPLTQKASSTSFINPSDYIDDTLPLPIYVISRASLAVPVDADHDVLALGAGFGIVKNPDPKDPTAWGHSIGMRFIWVPTPPKNPLSQRQASVDWAWGPVVDWLAIVSPRKRISFYTSLSLGFIYGTPSPTKNIDFEEKTGHKPKNLVLPIFEAGMGLRVLSRKLTRNQMRAFLSTEVGIVPGAMAPYAALSIGLL